MAFTAPTRLMCALALPLALAACGKSSPVGTMTATQAPSAQSASVQELDHDRVALLAEQPVAPTREIVTGEGSSAAGTVAIPTTNPAIEPFRPFGLGVVGHSSSAITLSWQTPQAAPAIVYFGKVGLFGFRGYTHTWQVPVASRTQQVTITGLNRLSKYRFMVVGLSPDGFQFPTWEVEGRTKLIGK